MNDKQLYYISIDNTGFPLLTDNKIVLLYDDQDKANAAANKLSKKHRRLSHQLPPCVQQ